MHQNKIICTDDVEINNAVNIFEINQILNTHDNYLWNFYWHACIKWKYLKMVNISYFSDTIGTMDWVIKCTILIGGYNILQHGKINHFVEIDVDIWYKWDIYSSVQFYHFLCDWVEVDASGFISKYHMFYTIQKVWTKVISTKDSIFCVIISPY